MSSSLRRGSLAAIAIAISIGSLAACGSGRNAQTLEIKPDNAATSIGDIKIQNAAILTQPEPEAEGPATVTGTIFNTGAEEQTLEAITLPDNGTQVELSPAEGSGPLTIPAGGSVQLGGEGNASAVITQGREAAEDGDAQQVVFNFSEQGEVPLKVFVMPATHYFEGYGPTQPPAATPESPDAAATETQAAAEH